MTSATVLLLDQAMELPPNERKQLAIRILESVDDGPYPPSSKQEFEADLQSRIQEIENGEIETVDALALGRFSIAAI
jgi:putative addiction module component (TIGR02574 family)